MYSTPELNAFCSRLDKCDGGPESKGARHTCIRGLALRKVPNNLSALTGPQKWRKPCVVLGFPSAVEKRFQFTNWHSSLFPLSLNWETPSTYFLTSEDIYYWKNDRDQSFLLFIPVAKTANKRSISRGTYVCRLSSVFPSSSLSWEIKPCFVYRTCLTSSEDYVFRGRIFCCYMGEIESVLR